MPNSKFELVQIHYKKVIRKLCFYLLLRPVGKSQPEQSPKNGRLPSVPFSEMT